MDLYDSVSFGLSKELMLRYSTSFGQSSKLFDPTVRKYIYAIYGLVRIADEIVDTYRGKNTAQLLDNLEKQTYEAMEIGYSSNPIVHCFAKTALEFSIDKEFIEAFFTSMRMDISLQTFTTKQYREYIYGSAEVIGLMCLRVFVSKDQRKYQQLRDGARHLGAAYQKVNFLRDMTSDYQERGRVYFPGCQYETFDQDDKDKIIQDINLDFEKARPAIEALPRNCQAAVEVSYQYYSRLLEKLSVIPVIKIKLSRVRISDATKLRLLCVAIGKFWWEQKLWRR